jgi:hypothetical protein
VREILRKALNWAVEMPADSEEGANRGDAADELLRLSGSNLETPAATVGTLVEQSPVSVPTEFPTVHQGGEIDFGAIYQAAGIPQNEAAAVERVGTLVERYGMMDRATARKAVIEAMSFAGVKLEDVLTDGGLKIQALVNYVESQEAQRRARESAAQQEFAELEKRMDALKTQIRTEREAQDALQRTAQAQAQRLEEVIDFLTPDAGPSPGASPGG